MLADELVARAQVFELGGQRLESALRQGALGLRDGTFVTGVVCHQGNGTKPEETEAQERDTTFKITLQSLELQIKVWRLMREICFD